MKKETKNKTALKKKKELQQSFLFRSKIKNIFTVTKTRETKRTFYKKHTKAFLFLFKKKTKAFCRCSFLYKKKKAVWFLTKPKGFFFSLRNREHRYKQYRHFYQI